MASWDETYQRIRRQFVESAAERLDRLDEAFAVLERGEDAAAFRLIRFEFHKLSGVAGSFGFAEVSRLALEGEMSYRAIEESGTPPGAAEISRWRELVAAIRSEFDLPAGS